MRHWNLTANYFYKNAYSTRKKFIRLFFHSDKMIWISRPRFEKFLPIQFSAESFENKLYTPKTVQCIKRILKIEMKCLKLDSGKMSEFQFSSPLVQAQQGTRRKQARASRVPQRSSPGQIHSSHFGQVPHAQSTLGGKVPFVRTRPLSITPSPTLTRSPPLGANMAMYFQRHRRHKVGHSPPRHMVSKISLLPLDDDLYWSKNSFENYPLMIYRAGKFFPWTIQEFHL